MTSHQQCTELQRQIWQIANEVHNSVNWIGGGDSTLINDERFAPTGVLAPKSKADFAFVLHALSYNNAIVAETEG